MTQPNKKDALGKGIRSLLQNIDADLKNTAGNLKSEIAERSTFSHRVALDHIEINPNQPRKDFDETSLNELATSIKMHNIIQPLTVSAIG
ncbi:MAG: ParB N-terminal domain-containing protein, partial [Ferruginibacter sp.]